MRLPKVSMRVLCKKSLNITKLDMFLQPGTLALDLDCHIVLHRFHLPVYIIIYITSLFCFHSDLFN